MVANLTLKKTNYKTIGYIGYIFMYFLSLFISRISNYISDLRFFETNFHCQGSEASLADCERREIKNWKVHCKTGKEVWVSCSDKQENVVLKPTPSKSSGEVSICWLSFHDIFVTIFSFSVNFLVSFFMVFVISRSIIFR